MYLRVDSLQKCLHFRPCHSLQLLHPALGQEEAPQGLTVFLVLKVDGHSDWVIFKQVVSQLADPQVEVGGDRTVAEVAVRCPPQTRTQQQQQQQQGGLQGGRVST